jgi:predicted HicB family RNase H-like nuclease
MQETARGSKSLCRCRASSFASGQSIMNMNREASMTIRVELNPEMERRLTAEALARGIALELYAQRLLQEAIAS